MLIYRFVRISKTEMKEKSKDEKILEFTALIFFTFLSIHQCCFEVQRAVHSDRKMFSST